jgi:plastocyanin
MPPEVLVPAQYAGHPEKRLRAKDVVALVACAIVAAIAVRAPAPSAQGATSGTIKGRITFTGKEPGNRVIRMGMDPMCAAANSGKRPVNEVYLVGGNNGLGNVFVKLEGSFPATPVPSQPVEIDQVACIYKPRVIGARVGQALRLKNADNLMHNVHSDSAKGNGFNFAEPIKGMQRDITLKDEEMLRIACDVHRWMTAWVGVVSHPYFAVSDVEGTFTIANVPAGKRTLTAWHEAFGVLTKPVEVKAGQTATVDFVYTQKP